MILSFNGGCDYIAVFQEFVNAFYEGRVTAEEMKESWKVVLAHSEMLRLSLSKLKKDQLVKLISGYVRSSDKKDYLIKQAWETLCGTFKPPTLNGDGVISLMEMYEFNKTIEQRVQEKVDNWTDELIQKMIDEHNKRIEARKAWYEEKLAAINNPQTLEDFHLFIKVKGREALTQEQLARFEELDAELTRTIRANDKAKQVTIESLTLPEGVTLSMQKTVHTREKIDLWVVQLSERVERDLYNALARHAGVHGGWYSSYCKNGAIPGFQFKTEEDAKKFMELGKVEGRERLEKWADNRQQKAIAHLTEVANNMKGEAQEILNRERLTNTVRRVRIANSVEAAAGVSIAIAETMLNLADAIAAKEVKFIDRIMYRTEIEDLETMLIRAQYARLRAEDVSWYKWEGTEICEADVNYVERFLPSINISNLIDLCKEFRQTPGLMKISERFIKACVAELRQDQYAYALKLEYDEVDDLRRLVKRAKLRRKFTYQIEAMEREILEFDRLKRLDLVTNAEVKTALREYLQYRGRTPDIDPLKLLRRELVGKILKDYFPTPKPLVQRMLSKLKVKPGMVICDPGAGSGHILEEVVRLADVKAIAVEINPTLSEILESAGFNVVASDFIEEFDPKKYHVDAFVANPPFSNHQDIEFVVKMYDCLPPGGQLISIMCESAFSSSHAIAQSFRTWFASVNGKEERNPQGSFRDSDNSTMVNTRLIVINK